MKILREMEPNVRRLSQQFPVVGILGPRQSGKTTLARTLFPAYKYVNLEELDVRRFANEDPRKFLNSLLSEQGVILDEVQHTPELFSYIQAEVDRNRKPGFFVLTGSQNILLNQHISQTLAGRIALFTLLPFTIEELKSASVLPTHMETLLFQGCYPPIYANRIDPLDWIPNYVRTYIERDVRQIRQVADLSLFQKFIQLCAGRVGQLLNLSSLGNDCGISTNTASAWISLLESSYIVFLLQPHHKNFSKRLIKTPKLYFYDTGVAAYLLGIRSSADLLTHYLRGGLFESMVLSDLMKQRYNAGLQSNLYFWRDQSEHEVDCILENGALLTPIEVKSGETVSTDFFDGLNRWNSLAKTDPTQGYVVYGGKERQNRSQGNVIGWPDLSSLPIAPGRSKKLL